VAKKASKSIRHSPWNFSNLPFMLCLPKTARQNVPSIAEPVWPLGAAVANPFVGSTNLRNFMRSRAIFCRIGHKAARSGRAPANETAVFSLRVAAIKFP
jgi:hypothetical protein